MGKALRTGAEYYGEESTVERPDGSRVDVLAHVSHIRDESNNHFGAVNLLVDVTERKRAQQRLFFTSSLLDQVRNAVVATDLQGNITYWNRYAESMYQWKPTEVLGKNILLLLVPEKDRESAGNTLQAVASTGCWEGVFSVQRKDGTIFPAYATDALLKDANGNPCGYVGVSEDFTVRQQLDEELRDREMRLRLFLEQIPAILWTTDRELRGLAGAAPAILWWLRQANGRKPSLRLLEAIGTTPWSLPTCALSRGRLFLSRRSGEAGTGSPLSNPGKTPPGRPSASSASAWM